MVLCQKQYLFVLFHFKVFSTKTRLQRLTITDFVINLET